MAREEGAKPASKRKHAAQREYLVIMGSTSKGTGTTTKHLSYKELSMSTGKYIRYTSIIYLLMMVFTFGHSYNKPCVHNGAACSSEKNEAAAPIAAMLWPFYWSIQLQNEEK